MKKIVYITMLAIISSLTITACTEEPVKPVKEVRGGGGAPSPEIPH